MTKKELRNFGLVLGVACLIIGGRLFFKWQAATPLYIATAGAFFIVLSFVYPAALELTYKIWMKLAKALGWINTRLLLILLFYFIIVPIGLFTKIIGKDFLCLRICKNKISYWVKREGVVINQAQYEKQF